MKGKRLSWPRHCNKGVRPVPKPVYIVTLAVVINTTRCDSITNINTFYIRQLTLDISTFLSQLLTAFCSSRRLAVSSTYSITSGIVWLASCCFRCRLILSASRRSWNRANTLSLLPQWRQHAQLSPSMGNIRSRICVTINQSINQSINLFVN